MEETLDLLVYFLQGTGKRQVAEALSRNKIEGRKDVRKELTGMERLFNALSNLR